MLNIGVMVSGGGTNLQALLDAADCGKITNGKIVTVVSNKQNAGAIARVCDYNKRLKDSARYVDAATILQNDFNLRTKHENEILRHLKSHNVGLVVLAGYLSILSENFLDKIECPIINVHPSLIPSFCGDGFYGIKVHEAALNYGVKITGATVHFVNNVTDGGKIILQKAVSVLDDDTPQTLQKRVMEQAEWIILPNAVNMICNGEIS